MESHDVTRVASPIELVRLLPFYARHPVIADANVLFQDTERYARTGFTVLTLLAKQDVIALLTCEHVRDRLPEIIAERGRNPSAQQHVWEEVYLPLVRFVRVPEAMCSGHPQIEAIVDPEDRPFGRLAIAVAPGLLLTRDHHFSDVGLGTEQWADALTILGDLVELDAALYGSAHTVVLLAWLAGQLVRGIWRALASEPQLSLAAAGLGLLLLIENKNDVIRRARAFGSAIQTSGTRVLDVAAPVLERRQDAEGHLTSRLERPSLPRSVESICARQMSTQRHPVTTEALLDACSSGGHKLVLPQFERFLRTHPSFTRTSAGAWELGALGLPVVDAATVP